MSHHYYLNNAGSKDGPHDLVTIMRRIRAKKIDPDTIIYLDESPTPLAASEIEDIALFFSHEDSESSSVRADAPVLSLSQILNEGWRFTAEHHVMTVFSGGIVLLAIVLATGLVRVLGVLPGCMVSWIMAVIFQYVFFACSLRFFRGQPLSSVFLKQQLLPALPLLFYAAIVIALMMVGGFLLLVIPAFAVAVYYIFVPFLIMDRKLTLIEAMYASRLLVQKHNRRYQSAITMLIIMHFACMILIFPIPVSLPMFVGSLAKIYEELSSF